MTSPIDDVKVADCARCHRPVAESAAIWSSVRILPTGGHELADPMCSAECANGAAAEHRLRAKCAGFECDEMLDGQRIGRPREYHDGACRKRTERVVTRALRGVALGEKAEPRQSDPGKQLAEASAQVAELSHLLRSWKQSGEMPARAVYHEANQKMLRLRGLADSASRLVQEQEADERDAAASKRGVAATRKVQAARNDWRSRLLAGLPADGSDV